MADYMHACPSCHTFYPPGVALGVRGGVCKCGAALFATTITPENFEKSGETAALEHVFGIAPAQNPQSQKNTAPTVQKPAVKYRKKPIPDEYSTHAYPSASSRWLCNLAWFAVFPGCLLLSIYSAQFRYAIAGLVLALFLWLFSRIAEDVTTISQHLGAIRWLMQHGDELEPVPQPVDKPSSPSGKSKKDLGTILATCFLVAIVVGLIVYYAFIYK